MEEPLKIICPVCQKSFTRNSNLRRHMSTHAKNKPKFLCNICNKIQASRLDTLLRHQKNCLINVATKEAVDNFGSASASSASQKLSPPSDIYSDSYSIPNSDSDLLMTVGLENTEVAQVGRDISPILYSKDAVQSDFFTINVPGLSNAASMTGSFGEMRLQSISNLTSQLSTPMMPSFLAPLSDLPPLIFENPLQEEIYLTYGIRYYTRDFPLLHISTWNKKYAHPLLKEALVMRGASYLRTTPVQSKVNDDYVLKVLQSDLRDRIFRTFMESSDDLDLQYELLLAMVLVQNAGCIHKSSIERGITDGYQGMTAVMLRHSGIFSYITNWRTSVNLFDLSAAHNLWEQWIRYESMKRLMLLVYVMDTLRPALSNIPPCFLHPELAEFELFLPVDEPLWAAPTAEDWLIERKPRDRTDILGVSLSYVMAAFLDSTRAVPKLNRFSSFVVIQSFQRSIYGYFILSEQEQYRYQHQQALYRWRRECLRIPPSLLLFDSGQFLQVEMLTYRLCILICEDGKRLSGNFAEDNFETLANWAEEVPDTTGGGLLRLRL
ncbi:hypothetical protein M422DRAFT_775177 [Sphaerobolus stellatus SS14]|nr:hypothetical protein M422DRAFT_775177 [Sphaerobolus stellatus SS14]